MKQEGVIKAIGLCNFDSIRTDEICTNLGRGAIVSNQVQVSSRTTGPAFDCYDLCMIVLLDRHTTTAWHG